LLVESAQDFAIFMLDLNERIRQLEQRAERNFWITSSRCW